MHSVLKSREEEALSCLKAAAPKGCQIWRAETIRPGKPVMRASWRLQRGHQRALCFIGFAEHKGQLMPYCCWAAESMGAFDRLKKAWSSSDGF